MKSRILLTALFVLGLPANALACGAYPVGTNTNDLVLGMVANGSNIVTYTSITNAGSSRQGMLVYNRTNNTLHLCNGGSWITLSAAAGVSAAGSTGQVQFNNGGALGADSGLFWDNTNKVLVTQGSWGASAPPYPRGQIISLHNNGAHASVVILRKSRGTSAAPTALLQNDYPGMIYPESYDGASYLRSGGIAFTLDGAVSANTVPTAIVFHTTPTWGDGVERMRISSAGNVGIGTTNPAAKLDVSTTIRALSAAPVAPSAGRGVEIWYETAGDFGRVTAYDRTGSAYKTLYIDGSDLLLNTQTTGNVGIGTTSPSEKLEVSGNVKMGYEQVNNSCTGTACVSVTATCSSGKYVIGGGCQLDNTTRYIYRNYPSGLNTWYCHSQLNLENAGSVIRAYAICANMR